MRHCQPLLLATSLLLASHAIAQQARAPLAQYLIGDRNAEIALARTAAPPSISAAAGVLVLTPQGYMTAAQGSNGFLCIVERSWGADSVDPEFWNPRVRSPICFNPAAAKTVVPFYLLKTRLVLAGKSKQAIDAALDSARDTGKLPPIAPNSMCYMLSRRQYLNDRDKAWRPHLMFFVAGDAAKTWGANLPGSPVLAAVEPNRRSTLFLLPVDAWSDGSPFVTRSERGTPAPPSAKH